MFLRLLDDLGVRRHVMARGRDLTAGGDITPPAGHGMTDKQKMASKVTPWGIPLTSDAITLWARHEHRQPSDGGCRVIA
ncbi:hypothetical protein PH213_33055 [Streptomyces sp. SRF1]|uniref:hypothetical protein n=1 Tax=Streptomyces sp. SRF1 TaxID=1549642 RepID=UPI0025B0D9E8|nr:hypothetical protein [Streptomyces sp. SRF1]MDN3059278.1 hypothetical protein [Streptomyces sp. SRF1]